MHDNAGEGDIIKLIQTFCVKRSPADRRRFFILIFIAMNVTFNSTKFSTHLKRKRQKNFISHRILASTVGVSYETLRRYENNGWAGDELGHCTPDLINFAKICLWLNMPMESFFTSK